MVALVATAVVAIMAADIPSQFTVGLDGNNWFEVMYALHDKLAAAGVGYSTMSPEDGVLKINGLYKK